MSYSKETGKRRVLRCGECGLVGSPNHFYTATEEYLVCKYCGHTVLERTLERFSKRYDYEVF